MRVLLKAVIIGSILFPVHASAGSITVTPGSGTTVGAGSSGTNQIPATILCGASATTPLLQLTRQSGDCQYVWSTSDSGFSEWSLDCRNHGNGSVAHARVYVYIADNGELHPDHDQYEYRDDQYEPDHDQHHAWHPHAEQRR